MAATDTKHSAVQCFETIFKCCDFCFAVIDAGCRIIQASPGLEKLLGYSAGELAGKKFTELLLARYDSSSSLIERTLNYFFENPRYVCSAKLSRRDGSVVGVRLMSRSTAEKGPVLVELIEDAGITAEHKPAAAADDSFLENIFSTTGDGLYVTDELGLIVKTNPALAAILGYSQQELIGKHSADFSAAPTGEDSPQVPAFMEQLLNTGVVENHETLWRRKDGTLVEVELKVTLLKNSAGAVIGAVGAGRDITLRNRSEAALRESEQRFRVLANSAPDAIIYLDSRGRIIFWNQGAQNIYGYDYKEMLGKTPGIIMPPDVLESHKKFFGPSRGASDNFGNLTFESFGLHKNGTRFPLEMSLSSGRAGEDIFYCAIARDTTGRKRAEAELKEARDFLEEVFLATGDGILITDREGRVVRVNAATERMLRTSEEDLRGQHTSELVPAAIKDPQYLERAAVMRKTLFAAGRIENFESAWKRPDGSIFPIEITSTLLNDGSGQFSGTISCVRDITERKKTEKALRESEERFRDLAQSLPEGIIAVDSNGAIVFWNQGAQNLFGYTKEETLGKPSTLLIPERYHETEKEGLSQLRQGGFSSFQGRTVQGFGLRKDGTEFADEISAGPWPTRQGLYYVAIIRDITERLKAEAALRESEQRFKELADSLPQTVFELTPDGIITFVNRTALEAFGYTPADIAKGLHALHMIVPEDRLTVSENLEKVLAGEGLGGQEYMALRKDGTTFPCIIHASTILADGRPQGLRGLLIDMTLRKELEEEMNKSKRLSSISTLAGGVAQDFNTVLSIILGNINLAQHQVAPEDRVAEHLAAAERATLRAKDLTAQLVAFAKAGTALKTIVPVEKLLREAADAALKGSNVNCSFCFPPDLLPARLDETQMRQVFMNLLINADHAMPEGGSIEVQAANIAIGPADNLPLPNGAYVKITICDQSIGILNEHLQQLFDPYFTSRQRGSGIGLATTYTIVKNHGGLITVESEFGRGTTFHIFLPADKSKK